MTKGQRILNIILIVVIGALAAASGFFYAKTVTLQKQVQASAGEATATPSTDLAPITDLPVTPSASISPAPTPSASVIPSAKLTPGTTGTYTVKAGDSMSSIASGLGVNWLTLAQANGLDATTANKIKIGQVLKVPAK